MFSSQRVVDKNSQAYKALLVGLSRKQLKRHDLDVDLDDIIKTVSQMGINFQAIGLCTLGIVRIHHGKVCVLLSDCQRASEIAKGIKMTKKVSNVDPVIPNVENLKNILSDLDQESCYIPSQPPASAIPANITIQENLPVVPYNVSNYEDFGNEGLLDFNVCFSQGIFQDSAIQESEMKLEEEVGVFENTEIEDSEYTTKIEEDVKLETFVDMQLPVNNFELLAASDIDTQISKQNPHADHFENRPKSILDLSSLKSYTSGKERRGRKRKFAIDESTKLSQTEMRENMNDFSDLINRCDLLAPPTRKMMKIQALDWFNLLTTCQVEGVKSNHGPVARKYQSLCKEAGILNRGRNYQVPDDVNDVIDILETQKTREDEFHPLPPENVDENDNLVQKWLEESMEIDGLEFDMPPEIAAPEQNMELPDNDDVLPLKNKHIERPATRRRVELEEVGECNEEEKNMAHAKFLETIEELEQRDHEVISFDEVLRKLQQNGITRKVAARQFMTMLELKKLQKIDISQPNPNDSIVVKRV